MSGYRSYLKKKERKTLHRECPWSFIFRNNETGIGRTGKWRGSFSSICNEVDAITGRGIGTSDEQGRAFYYIVKFPLYNYDNGCHASS